MLKTIKLLYLHLLSELWYIFSKGLGAIGTYTNNYKAKHLAFAQNLFTLLSAKLLWYTWLRESATSTKSSSLFLGLPFKTPQSRTYSFSRERPYRGFSSVETFFLDRFNHTKSVLISMLSRSDHIDAVTWSLKASRDLRGFTTQHLHVDRALQPWLHRPHKHQTCSRKISTRVVSFGHTLSLAHGDV